MTKGDNNVLFPFFCLKKLLLVCLCLLLWVNTVHADQGDNVSYNYFYMDYRNEYRMDFWDYPSSAVALRFHFETTTGTIYEKTFKRPLEWRSNIWYITCNGTYNYFFEDAAGNVVAAIENQVTTQIKNPPCNSYDQLEAKNDLNLRVDSKGDGTHDLGWDSHPGATSYDIYKDGNKIGQTNNGSYTVTGDGSYSVVAKDSNGNHLASSDAVIQNGGDKTGAESGSDDEDCSTRICQCIQSLKPALNEISSNTGGILEGVGTLIGLNEDIKGVLEQIRNHLNVTPEVHDMPKISDYPEIKLEDNKPLMHEDGPFIDNSRYFADPGDDVVPPAFPVAPDPAEQWEDFDGNVISQEEVIEKEDALEKDEEIVKDEEIRKDVEIEQDEALEKDEEIQQDELLEKDEELIQDTPITEADDPLQQDKTEYPLRWHSSEYGN